MSEVVEKIDWLSYDCNYQVSFTDIQATQLDVSNVKNLKAVLWLFGMDTNKYWEVSTFQLGSVYRSPLTGLVQEGGTVYSGHLRTDPNWKKEGHKITLNYLFGKDVNKTKSLLKEAK